MSIASSSHSPRRGLTSVHNDMLSALAPLRHSYMCINATVPLICAALTPCVYDLIAHCRPPTVPRWNATPAGRTNDGQSPMGIKCRASGPVPLAELTDSVSFFVELRIGLLVDEMTYNVSTRLGLIHT